jgi:hypothetical protein
VRPPIHRAVLTTYASKPAAANISASEILHSAGIHPNIDGGKSGSDDAAFAGVSWTSSFFSLYTEATHHSAPVFSAHSRIAATSVAECKRL